MKALRRTLLGTLLVMLCGIAAAQKADQQIKVDITPQPLRGALAKLAEQTGVQLLFSEDEVPGNINAPRVVGTYTLHAALKELLAQTTLRAEFINARTVAIRTEKGARNTSSNLSPADQMRVAGVSNDAEANTPSGKEGMESDDGRQIVVKDRRVRPSFDVNADIPRTINDVQPYYIFDSETLERSGATNIEDFLKQRLTMNTVAQTNSQKSSVGESNTDGATSTINLRGLGSDKTLILVNGRRMAGIMKDGYESEFQPDLNGIALSAIDRIEVLPSSASGIYGGGAIGGVVNVILKKDYSGGNLKVTYENTWDMAAPQRGISGSYGLTLEGGKTQVRVSASWSEARPILLEDRMSLFRRNLDDIQTRVPDFLYVGAVNPWLGNLPNIVSVPVFVPVPAGTPGSYGPYPPGTDFGGGPTTPELPNVAQQAPPLVLQDGQTALHSSRTYVPSGTSEMTAPGDLASGLLANAGHWNFDFPRSTQSKTGMLQPLGSTPETRSLLVSGRRQMMPGLELFADVSISENRSGSVFNPIGSYLQLPANAQSNPFTASIKVAVPDATQVPVDVRSRSHAATVGALIELTGDWTGALDYTWSESRMDSVDYGFDNGLANDDLLDGILNPLVDTLLHPLDLSRYLSRSERRGKNRLSSMAIRGSGSLPSLPWGSPVMTVGLEHRIVDIPERTLRRELAVTVTDNYLTRYYARKSTTSSGYLEITAPLVSPQKVPLLHALDLQLSGRGERYEVDTGTLGETIYNRTPPRIVYLGTTLNDQPYFDRASYQSRNYTVGLRYKPVRDVIVRISRATAFVPPAPTDLLINPLTEFQKYGAYTTVNDPVTGLPVDTDVLSGGNPDLKPQNSISLNAGIIWEPQSGPLKGLRANTEYYEIAQLDAIGYLDPQQIVNQESAYPGRVTRNDSGAITLVNTSLVNLYRRDTAGWDLGVSYSLDTAAGRFSLDAMESIILRLRNQYSQVLPAYDSIGFPSDGGAARHKTNVALSWERGALTMGWTARHFGSYKAYGAAGGPYSMQFHGGTQDDFYIIRQGGDTIPAQTYHDLFIRYSSGQQASGRRSLFRGMTVQLGIRNVFDKAPPLDAYYQSNFYASPYGDMQLRSWSLSLQREF